jgi:pyruvyltransferase
MLNWIRNRIVTASAPINRVRCWPGGGHLNQLWNWGDAVSPTIYRLVTGEEPELIDFLEYPSEPHLIICGSTLRWLSKTSVIWGAGAISETGRFMEKGEAPLKIAAVRGPLTRKRFTDLGIRCPKVYGDPALLFPKYYQPQVKQEFDLGIIPHYIDQDSPALEQLSKNPRVKIIDITQKGVKDNVYSFIDDIAQCRRIASSSLHGLIVADGYAIPSLWLEFSKKIVGKGFKFHDYFQSVGRKETTPLQMVADSPSASDIIKLIDNSSYTIDFKPERLLDSFPG